MSDIEKSIFELNKIICKYYIADNDEFKKALLTNIKSKTKSNNFANICECIIDHHINCDKIVTFK